MNLSALQEAAGAKTHKKGKSEFDSLFSSSTVDSLVLVTKGSAILSKEIAKAERTRNHGLKLDRYRTALTHAKLLKVEAKKIPPDKWTDQVYRMLNPSFSSVFNYTKAVLVEHDLKNMSRNDAIDQFNKIIKAIQARIRALEKKKED